MIFSGVLQAASGRFLGRCGMIELEADMFCDLDPDTHAHVLTPTHKYSHPTRALNLAVICDVRDQKLH